MDTIKKIKGYNAKKLQRWWKLLPSCRKCEKKSNLMYKNSIHICIQCYHDKYECDGKEETHEFYSSNH